MPEFENAGNLIAKQIAAQPSAMEQAQQGMSLVDLGNKIGLAPLERQAKELENELKRADVDMIGVKKMRAQVDLQSAVADEKRKQGAFFYDHLQGLAQAFEDDFEQGVFALANTLPNAKAKELEDGSVSITAALPGGGTKSFKLFPSRSKSSPEQRVRAEQQLKSDWEKQGQTFVTMDQSLRTMKQYALDPTGPNDTAFLVLASKAWDPNSVVREGEVEVIRNTGNLPEILINAYNRQKDGKRPFLGENGSALRRDILDTVQKKVDISRTDLRSSATGMIPVWKGAGYDPRKIYTPLASLNVFEDSAAPGAAEPPPGVGVRGPEPVSPRRPGAAQLNQSAQPGQGATVQPVSPAAPPPKPKYNIMNQTGTFLRQRQNSKERR